MIEIELFPCCLECEYSDLEIEESPALSHYDPDIKITRIVEKVTTVSCKHWPVCKQYLEDKERIYISRIIKMREEEKDDEN